MTSLLIGGFQTLFLKNPKSLNFEKIRNLDIFRLLFEKTPKENQNSRIGYLLEKLKIRFLDQFLMFQNIGRKFFKNSEF